ncbi:hypothetical protein ACJX0J_023879, partial [Zea mays]
EFIPCLQLEPKIPGKHTTGHLNIILSVKTTSIINENDWKFQGIVNGIDTADWNPRHDVHLQSDGAHLDALFCCISKLGYLLQCSVLHIFFRAYPVDDLVASESLNNTEVL